MSPDPVCLTASRGQALGQFLRLRQHLLQRKNLGDRALLFGLLDDERAPGQGDTGPG